MSTDTDTTNSKEDLVGIVDKISTYLRARPRGIVILVGFEVFSAFIFFLAILDIIFSTVVQYDDNIYFIGGFIATLFLVYGLWQGRSWAWALRLILSVIGLVVLWPNIFMIIPQSYIRTYTIAYVGHFIVIIIYLLRPNTKAYYNIQAAEVSDQNTSRTRLPFIDFARGIVMILMAWDHVSVFWDHGHRGSEGLLILSSPNFLLRPKYANFTQFLARFVTHWCAPTFIFLTGTALALSTIKRINRGDSQRDITLQFIKRGIVLILLEIFVVALAFGLPMTYIGVLVTIGMGLIIFSVLRRAPPLAILILSIIIILGHPYFDLDWLIPKTLDADIRWYIKIIIYQPNFDWFPYVGLYPILPWLGVMGLGWCFGIFITSYDQTKIEQLSRPLAAVGGTALGLWLVVRLINGYGNLLPRLGTTDNTLQDWLLMSKCPPSLAFLLWTLGGTCFFLALGLVLQKRTQFTQSITGIILTFGRVPLFFYITHLYLYRLWPIWTDFFRSFVSYDFGLMGTAILWVNQLFILWRLCLWYENLKRSHPHSLLKYI